ncbi:amidase [Pigmentiphaga soli]|uniref:Amidase n=1 Tax=Pigmentiphaga soli TaxID=1007095 RepID=A0ABP8GFX3_9BURK
MKDSERGGAAPWELSAGELCAAYAAGALSPVDAVRSIAERRAAVEPRINAIAVWDEDGALAAAKASEARWRAGRPLSPMDGVPLTVKDNIPVAGLPCRWGSLLYADHVPAVDELPVRRLREAGAVLLGKTNVPEFTLLGYTASRLAGVTRNPWNPELTPGGSSGGAAAAVAAGIGPVALATDGGGSIRRPCSHTGLAGLKPSRGRVPRADGLPEILPGMEVIGPIARTMDDLLRLLAVIGPAAPAPAPLRAPGRIVYWRHVAGGPVDAQVLTSIDAAAERLCAMGHEVAEEDAPAAIDRFNREAWPAISAGGLAAMLAPLAARLGETALRDALTPEMAAMWDAGRALPAAALPAARQCVARLRDAVGALFSRCDALLTPAAAALPWPAAQPHPDRIDGRPAGPRGHAVFTAFANACGLPGLALPAEPAAGGLPVGLQLVGPRGSDDRLCALGRDWESAQPWRHRRPALADLDAKFAPPPI